MSEVGGICDRHRLCPVEQSTAGIWLSLDTLVALVESCCGLGTRCPPVCPPIVDALELTELRRPHEWRHGVAIPQFASVAATCPPARYSRGLTTARRYCQLAILRMYDSRQPERRAPSLVIRGDAVAPGLTVTHT
ncbi:hypothetical protein OH76DRAFT_1491075 [Lentinus brumalis]|uniref:Uncharacterized protein n=1 Tax=Lentinus brumalis TaxID=2498619 RepID=A0A371CGV0_9APHY|nr:hypothetical protein OH76DRAFT_1491075 [Polyporus brumalis]